MRLRRKLTIAFFGVSALLSVLFALFLYRFIERQLTSDLRDRLRDIAHLGAHAIDLEAYGRLVAQLDGLGDAGTAGDAGAPGAPDERHAARVAAIEDSADYKTLSDQLNVIRSAEPTLIQYAYLLAPSQDVDRPRFVADADVLADRAKGGGAMEKTSHFGQTYEVTEFPHLKRAIGECRARLEPDFVYDSEFGVRSVSAYMPLPGNDGAMLRDGRGRCLGVLGVDITDRQMRGALDATSNLAIKLSLGIVALALLVSIAMGTVLTRSVLVLTQTVKRFAEKDFSARIDKAALPRDEIGQLGNNFNAMAATIQLHSENLEGLVQQRTKELVAEKQTSERLLLNVLPGPIAERLKGGESLIVDRFESVSVLFADLVGFTTMASHTSPEALVTMLNDLFSMYDGLAERHGLEKIKTIGDSYLVVAGIPAPVADSAGVIVEMALDMLAGLEEYSRRRGMKLEVRIGIHTGSVVAGVIGTKKFIYDLWGDTVNMASRMESAGVPGRIQVSEAMYGMLAERFELEERGPIEIKGKGAMQVYLVAGRREAEVAGP